MISNLSQTYICAPRPKITKANCFGLFSWIHLDPGCKYLRIEDAQFVSNDLQKKPNSLSKFKLTKNSSNIIQYRIRNCQNNSWLYITTSCQILRTWLAVKVYNPIKHFVEENNPGRFWSFLSNKIINWLQFFQMTAFQGWLKTWELKKFTNSH